MYNHPFFKNINESLNDFNVKEYHKGALIFNESESCSQIGLIIEGSMKISTLNYDEEYLINIVNAQEIFGDALIFNDDNRYLGDGIAITDLKIIFISKSKLLQLLQNSQFLINYLKIISNKNLLIKKQLKLANQKTLKAKILFYLTQKAKALNTSIIPIISKEHLAQILNVPRPSLSRELLKLQRAGIIELKRKAIIIRENKDENNHY